MVMTTRAPLYDMSDEQERRFFRAADRLRSFGYWIRSEPIEGQIDGWLDGVETNIARIERRLVDVNKAFRTRGKSKAARYFLTSDERLFDPGFGIALTHEQHLDNERYAAQLARGAARWDAGFRRTA